MKKFLSITTILCCLLLTACNKDKGKGIKTKFKFSGTPTAQSSQSPTKKSNSVEGAEQYDLFYSKLGAKKGSITPTSLELAIGHLALHGTDESGYYSTRLIGGDGAAPTLVDLANPIVITLDEIEPGNYKLVEFSFSFTGLWNPQGEVTSKVSFPKPAGFNFSTHRFATLDGWYNVTEVGNNIVAKLALLHPNDIVTYVGGLDVKLGTISNIFLGGNTYRVIDSDTINGVNLSKIVPGLPNHPYLNSAGLTHLVVPFEGIVIPENATAVRFEIFWNMKDIIEWYEGKTDSPDDDIFVLRNRFWEAFSIRAIIE